MASVYTACSSGWKKVTKLCLTRVEVLVFLGKVLVLVHPLPVTFEEDL